MLSQASEMLESKGWGCKWKDEVVVWGSSTVAHIYFKVAKLVLGCIHVITSECIPQESRRGSQRLTILAYKNTQHPTHAHVFRPFKSLPSWQCVNSSLRTGVQLFPTCLCTFSGTCNQDTSLRTKGTESCSITSIVLYVNGDSPEPLVNEFCFFGISSHKRHLILLFTLNKVYVYPPLNKPV